MNPELPDCHYNMAEILYHRYQLQDALEQYRLAGVYANKPNIELSCLVNSAEILLTLGDERKASAALSEASRIDPENSAVISLSRRLRYMNQISYGREF